MKTHSLQHLHCDTSPLPRPLPWLKRLAGQRPLRHVRSALLLAASLAATPSAHAELDFGDAPVGFPTLLPAGARHTIVAGVRMGPNIDAEPNGLASPDALGGGAGGFRSAASGRRVALISGLSPPSIRASIPAMV